MAGHLSGPKVYKAMSWQWWQQNMYSDIINYSCQCAIVTGSGRRQLLLLRLIPVDHPFQIVGLDIMALPLTAGGNIYVIDCISGHLYQVQMVYAAPDQETERITKLLTHEIMPLFGPQESQRHCQRIEEPICCLVL